MLHYAGTLWLKGCLLAPMARLLNPPSAPVAHAPALGVNRRSRSHDACSLGLLENRYRTTWGQGGWG